MSLVHEQYKHLSDRTKVVSVEGHFKSDIFQTTVSQYQLGHMTHVHLRYTLGSSLQRTNLCIKKESDLKFD